MPAPLSLDLRQRIQATLESVGSQRRVTERFQVSRSTVERLAGRVRLTGSPTPKPHAGGRALLIAEDDRARVLEWVRAESDLTQEEIACVDSVRLKVVDESRVEVGQRLGYGYSPCGERCYDSAPYRSKHRQNLIGWLDFGGEGVVASCLSTVKGWTFRGFVRQHLAPHFKAGGIVVWDNVRIHGVEGTREMIEEAGARLLPLPRYRP